MKTLFAPGDQGLSRLAKLRCETSNAHAAIEAVPVMSRLMAKDLSLTEYVTVLCHMHRFLARLEPMLGHLLSRHDAAIFIDGTRLAALADDLKWFSTSPTAKQPKMPSLSSTLGALGALYVVEGATLGGRIIARHVGESLGVAPGAGGTYYGGINAEKARMRWISFSKALERPISHSIGCESDDDMLAGANETFACLARFLARIPVLTPGEANTWHKAEPHVGADVR
jgi:heme oxygenase